MTTCSSFQPPSCESAAAHVFRRARPFLGTIVEILATHSSQAIDLSGAVQRAFSVIDRLHRLLSFHDPQSDPSRLNREALHRPVQVAPETWSLLTHARELHERSSGVFEVAIAPLLTRWGYLPRTPNAAGSHALLGSTADIQLCPDQTVRFRRPLQIDLGGIAKGYAVDYAISELQACGAGSGCVNAGGDLRVFGASLQDVWLRDPQNPGRLFKLPPLFNEALATSATYFSAKNWRGQRVCPLVNGRTRRCLQTELSVTVRAPSCLLADALTKVVAFAAPDVAEALLDHYQAEALVLPQREESPHAA